MFNIKKAILGAREGSPDKRGRGGYAQYRTLNVRGHSGNKGMLSSRLILDILILLLLPLFFAGLHIFSKKFSFMNDDNLLAFSNFYNVIQLSKEGGFPVRDPYLYLDLFRTGSATILYWVDGLFFLLGSLFFAHSVELLRILWTALQWLHTCLPAISMYFLLKYCKFSRWACVVGGLVYGWNLNTFGLYEAHHRLVHAAVIPLIWLIAMYSLDSKKYYLNISSGMLMGWAVLAGGLQPVVYIIPFLFIYLFVGLISGKHFTRKNILRAIFIPLSAIISLFITALPLIVTAPQILPYLNRFDNQAGTGENMFSTAEFFLGLIKPFTQWKILLHNPGKIYEIMPWETVRYFGFISVLLLLIGLCVSLKKNKTKNIAAQNWFLFIFISSFLFCLWYAYFPGFILKLFLLEKGLTRYPFRFYYILMFATAFFVARGIDYFLDNNFKKSRFGSLIFWFAVCSGIFLFVLKVSLGRPVFGGRGYFFFSNILALMALILFVIVYLRPRWIWLCAFLLILDLGLVEYVLIDNLDAAYGFKSANKNWYKYSFLREQDQYWIKSLPQTDIPYRVYIIPFEERPITAGTGYIFNKLRHPFGYDGGVGLSRMLYFKDILDATHPIFDILGVRIFYVNEGFYDQMEDKTKPRLYLLLNDNSLPLMFFLKQARFFDTDAEVIDSVYKGDSQIREVVYLSRESTGKDVTLFNKFVDLGKDKKLNAQLANITYSSSKVQFLISSPEDIIFVLSEPWLPPWRAWIDGQTTRIYQAYGLIQAILIPAGIHSVRFVYTFPIQLIFISIVGQIGVVIFSIIILRKPPENAGRVLA